MSEAGPRRQSQSGPVAVRSLVLSASKGRGKRDLSVEGASGLESGGIGVLPWKGSLVLFPQLAQQASHGGRSATGSVRGLIVRSVQRKRTPAHGLTSPTEMEAAPGKQARRGEGELVRAPFARRTGRKRHDWRTRHQIAASLGAGDAFGLSGAELWDAVQPQHLRVGERLGACGEVREVRASRP